MLLTETVAQPFAAVLQKTVLDPIGMKDSTYEQPLPAALRARAAFAYRGEGSPVAGDYDTYSERAAAGLWTTAPDLATFGIEIQESRDGRSNLVLSESTTKLILTRQRDDDASVPSWKDRQQRSALAITESTRAIERSCSSRLTVRAPVIMTNSDNGMAVEQELAYSIGAEYEWKDFGAKD